MRRALVTASMLIVWACAADPGSSPAPDAGCHVGGCSGEVCSAEVGVASGCVWRPEYACYRDARCERQPDGACGWTATPELQACLESARR